MLPCPPLNGPPIASGNMGELWVDPTNPDVLIKRFRTPQNRHESELLVDLNNLLYKIRPSAKETLKQNFAWPLDLFGNSSSITAIKIPLAPKSFYRDIKMLGDTDNKLMTLQYLVDKDWWTSAAVESREPKLTIEDRIEFSHHMLTTLLILWESGGVYGDFSFMNLIWSTEPTPRIMFLDADTATADNTYDRQLHSPGWREHLLPGLNPLQKDFRLSSLAIWRIFSQTQRGYPDDQNLTNALNQVESEVRLAIQDLWSNMTIESAKNLHLILHKYRDDRYIKLLFENAIKDGFAKHAIQQMPHSPTKFEKDQISKVANWIEIELQFETKRGRNQARFGRIHGNNPEFVLDVTNAPAPVDFTKPESVINAFRDGDFALIAENFDQFSPSSPQFQYVKRAVEHALVEEQIPVVDFIEGTDYFQANWVFPATSNWINRAVMSVFDINGVVIGQKVVQRRAIRSGVKIPYDQQVASISICWRAENSTGVGIDSPNSWNTRISASQLSVGKTHPTPTGSSSTGLARPRIILETQNTFTRELPDVQAVPPKRLLPAEPLRVQQPFNQIDANVKRSFLSRLK
jgi:hypothetical protein